MVHASSLAPVFVAAGALIRVATATTGRDIPADDFFQLPDKNLRGENVLAADEVVSEFVIPRQPAKSGYVEFREKQSFDWPLASCTAVHDGKAWRVVLGHVAPAPWRAAAAEAVLAGADDVDGPLAEKAADAALEGATPLSQNEWRLKLVRASVRRALLMACGKDPIA